MEGSLITSSLYVYYWVWWGKKFFENRSIFGSDVNKDWTCKDRDKDKDKDKTCKDKDNDQAYKDQDKDKD